MPWNYRVVRTVTKTPLGIEDTYQVHEVYYDDPKQPDLPTACGKQASVPIGEDIAELKRVFEMQQLAFDLPILDMEHFENREKPCEPKS